LRKTYKNVVFEGIQENLCPYKNYVFVRKLTFSSFFILFHPFSSKKAEKGRKRQKKAEKGRDRLENLPGIPSTTQSLCFFKNRKKKALNKRV